MIIGIAGKKCSGKDTAAKVFERLGFTHDSFAAPNTLSERGLS